MTGFDRCASLAALLWMAGCTMGPGGDVGSAAYAPQDSVPAEIDCGRFAAGSRVFDAHASGTAAGAAAPLGSVLDVRLHSLPNVSPLTKPGRQEKSQSRYAGLVPLRIEASGIYAVLVASTAWADIVAANPARVVEAQSFRWVSVCGKRFKRGLYALGPGGEYFVQLWDSPDRDLTLVTVRLR